MFLPSQDTWFTFSRHWIYIYYFLPPLGIYIFIFPATEYIFYYLPYWIYIPLFHVKHAPQECVLRHHYDVKNAEQQVTSTVVIGECVMFHAIESLLGPVAKPTQAPSVRLDEYQPLARLGGDGYARVVSTFDIKRPKV